MKRVDIGELAVAGAGESMETNLGSCLGIAILWPARRRVVLCHVLLPEHPGTPTDRRYARYADTAPRHMLRRLRVPDEHLRSLRVVIAGGATLYAQTNQIGAKNIRHGVRALRALGLRILGRDVGEGWTRRMRVSAETGCVEVTRTAEADHTTRTWRVRWT